MNINCKAFVKNFADFEIFYVSPSALKNLVLVVLCSCSFVDKLNRSKYIFTYLLFLHCFGFCHRIWISHAENPEYWNWQFQQDKIFADNFLYCIQFYQVFRLSYSICRYIYVRYSFKRKLIENYMSILCSFFFLRI